MSTTHFIYKPEIMNQYIGDFDDRECVQNEVKVGLIIIIVIVIVIVAVVVVIVVVM